jgi:hypothetical protein
MNKFDKFSQIIHNSPIHLWRWNRQSVPKRRHIKFRRRGITKKKTHNNSYNWLYNLLGQILCYCNTKFWRKEEGKDENVSNIMEPYNTQAGTEPECIVHCNMNGLFTFIWPRIVMHCYSKANQMHQFLKFILFCSSTLHVLEGPSVHHQESKTVHTASGICQTNSADCLLAGTSSISFPLASSKQNQS